MNQESFLNKTIYTAALFLFMVTYVYSQGNQQRTIRTQKTTTKPIPTFNFRLTFNESCDYIAHYCYRAYNTGKICGRTLFYMYHTFRNYCMMDYVNCMERYEIWQIVHMGECFDFPLETEYALYHYENDDFLNETYALEDH